MPDSAVVDLPPATSVREKLFTVAEFDALAARGAFAGPARYELWDGRVMMAPPPDGPHMSGERALNRVFLLSLSALGLLGRFEVQPGGGLPIGEGNLRGPDLMILKAPVARDRRPSPGEVALLVEVAATSQVEDLGEKREKYAFAGIAEYWVLDVAARRLHVFRDPAHGAWAFAATLAPEDHVSPLFASDISLPVADLFG